MKKKNRGDRALFLYRVSRSCDALTLLVVQASASYNSSYKGWRCPHLCFVCSVLCTQVDVLDLASCHWNPNSTDPTLTWDQQNTVEWWEAFKTLNTTFADHMMNMIR